MADPEQRELAHLWEEKQQGVIRAAREAYTWAVTNGLAKEQARVVLPEGNTESRVYMNGTLRSWVHFIELRSGNGTQKEHQLVAVACARAIAAIFPMSESLINKE
jgi:thymidylate synthase (FAD)